MADISMDYNAVLGIGNAAFSLQGEVSRLISDFKATTEELRSGWTGKGEQHFSQKFEAALPSMNLVADVLMQYQPMIKEAVSLQQATEKAGAVSAGQLTF